MPDVFPLDGKRIWIAGHRGMVGSALVRRLARENCDVITISRQELDLLRQADVDAFVQDARLDAIVVAAARVGGILANSEAPADFLQDNLVLQTNVIGAADRAGVSRLLFLGSSCIYPKMAPQPIEEESLLTGPLEPTNEWYAIAKIAGLKLVEAMRRQRGRDYISAMPTNLYGPNDNFDPASSHVLPALIRRVYEAKAEGAPAITIWGSGTPRREFLHVDDCADALILLLKRYSGNTHVNVGAGEDISIADLASLVARVAGYNGEIRTDPSKPDGTPRKLLSTRRLDAMGWRPAVSLTDGIRSTYELYAAQRNTHSERPGNRP